MAFEFYAFDDEYEVYINECIEQAEDNLIHKSPSMLETLKDLKGQLLCKAKQFNG